MLKLEIPDREWFDESKMVFVKSHGGTIQLEHSLVSISKWESKWKKPFLQVDNLQGDQLEDYIRFMTITQNVKAELYKNLTPKNLEVIKNYIGDSMTATWFKENNKPKSRRIITSELIYCWMSEFGLPFETCQKWHLNRLLTLIRVCQEERSGTKDPRSNREQMRDRNALNAARKKKYGTKG